MQKDISLALIRKYDPQALQMTISGRDAYYAAKRLMDFVCALGLLTCSYFFSHSCCWLPW